MPFSDYCLKAVRNALLLAGKDGKLAEKLCCFTCPDIVVPPAELFAIFETASFEVKAYPNSAGIIRWHKCQAQLPDGKVFDTWDFFEKLGVEVTAFDVEPSRGREVEWDLSNRLPFTYYGRYDVVLDIVSNQCFEVTTAVRNALLLCRPGGYIVHCLPVAMVNQGFYSLSPTFFKDFYETAGCEIVEHHLVQGNNKELNRIKEFHPSNRMRGVHEDMMNLVTVKKTGRGEQAKPIMTKFKIRPGVVRDAVEKEGL